MCSNCGTGGHTEREPDSQRIPHIGHTRTHLVFHCPNPQSTAEVFQRCAKHVHVDCTPQASRLTSEFVRSLIPAFNAAKPPRHEGDSWRSLQPPTPHTYAITVAMACSSRPLRLTSTWQHRGLRHHITRAGPAHTALAPHTPRCAETRVSRTPSRAHHGLSSPLRHARRRRKPRVPLSRTAPPPVAGQKACSSGGTCGVKQRRSDDANLTPAEGSHNARVLLLFHPYGRRAFFGLGRIVPPRPPANHARNVGKPVHAARRHAGHLS